MCSIRTRASVVVPLLQSINSQTLASQPRTLQTQCAGDLISKLALCDDCSPLELWSARDGAGIRLPEGSLAGILELLQDRAVLEHHLAPSPYLLWPTSANSSGHQENVRAAALLRTASEWHIPEHRAFARPYSQLWVLRELLRREATRHHTEEARACNRTTGPSNAVSQPAMLLLAHAHVPSSLFDPAPYDHTSVFQALRLPHIPPPGLRNEIRRALLCSEATELLQSASFLAEMFAQEHNTWWQEDGQP
eukprot:TRINITY_DN10588_c0_g1_i1.p1 TRINITY_DN10588_c0_g1~~TRINITY_DN10588_c0_g1_i1.p1  ORF type:complete len:250 (+),score=29.14 TRINITY_DN10588_c0_g1_i1:116-865(+)